MGDFTGPEKDTLETNHLTITQLTLYHVFSLFIPTTRYFNTSSSQFLRYTQLRVFVPCPSSICKISAESVAIHVFVLPRPCRGFDMLETSLSNFVTMLYRGLPIDNAECQLHWRASDIRHTWRHGLSWKDWSSCSSSNAASTKVSIAYLPCSFIYFLMFIC